jgi:hypothetical protein
MPTVLRRGGLRLVIYPNDHPPAHVHVLGPGWAVVINLIGPEVRRALQPIVAHRDVLVEAWKRIHD